MKSHLAKNYEETIKTKVFAHKMSKLNKIANRSDYQYILSLTFIKKQKDATLQAQRESIKRQFQNDQSQEEFKYNCVGTQPRERELEDHEPLLEIPEAMAINEQKMNDLIGYTGKIAPESAVK